MSSLATQWIINETNKTISVVVDVNGKKLELLADLTNSASQREIQLLNLALLNPDADNYEADLEAKRLALKDSATSIANFFNQLNEMEFSKEEQAIYDEIKANMSGANAAFGSFMTAISEGFQEEAIEIMHDDFRPKYQAFSSVVTKLQNLEKEKNRKAVKELYEQEEQSQLYMWSALLIAVILFAIVGTIITRSLLRPIEALESTMLKIVETGELKHRITVYGNDELARTSKSVNLLLDDISHAVFGVNGVLKDIAKGNFDNRVESELKGDFLSMKNEVNTSVDQISGVVSILEKTAHNFRTGVLQVYKDDSTQLEGKFSDVLYDL